MKRRIIKLGTTTLVTSLPSKWVKQFDLKPGDYVDVSERNKDLVLSTEKSVAVMEKVLDCRKINARIAEEFLLSAYILGYHTIEVLHDPEIKEYKTRRIMRSTDFFQNVLHNFVGVEIVDQSETRTVIKELAAVSPDELMVTLRRIFLLIKEMSSATIEAVEKRDKDLLSGMNARLNNVRKFLYYFQRVLNRFGYTDFSKTNLMSVLANNLLFISVLYGVAALNTLAFKHQYSKKAIEALHIVHDGFVRFSEVFFNYKPENAVELINLREKFLELYYAERPKMSAEDGNLYANLSAIFGHLTHSIRIMFGLQL